MKHVLHTHLLFSEQTTCSTPAGVRGDCKSIYDCPPLLTILQKGNALTADEKALLQRSLCVFNGGTPLVSSSFIRLAYSLWVDMGNSREIDIKDMYQPGFITHSLYQFASECISISFAIRSIMGRHLSLILLHQCRACELTCRHLFHTYL